MDVLIWPFLAAKLTTSGEQNLNRKPIEFIIDAQKIKLFTLKASQNFLHCIKDQFTTRQYLVGVLACLILVKKMSFGLI